MSKRCLTCYYHKQRWEEAEGENRRLKAENERLENRRLKAENERLREYIDDLEAYDAMMQVVLLEESEDEV